MEWLPLRPSNYAVTKNKFIFYEILFNNIMIDGKYMDYRFKEL